MLSKYIIPAVHVIFWSLLLLLPIITIPNEKSYFTGSDLPAHFYTISNFLHLVLFYFNASFLYPRLAGRGRWWLYFLCFVLLIIGAYYLKIVVVQWWYPSFRVTEETSRYVFFPALVFLLLSIVYRLAVDKVENDRKARELTAERLETELKFLRSQISPHFLFNILTNLVSLARKKSDLLEPSLIKLSDLVRYMLYEPGKEKILLETEMAYLESYIELQQLRFDQVKVTFDVQPSDIACAIEPMLLIPFVENAFKHGVGLIEAPCITIKMAVDGNCLDFRVINKYNPDERSKDNSPGIGLNNVKARLELMYPGRHTLLITRDNNIYDVQLKMDLLC